MAREILFNAFAMNCVGHQSPGLWRHPQDRSSDYTSLAHWADLARLLERGRFDALFLNVDSGSRPRRARHKLRLAFAT